MFDEEYEYDYYDDSYDEYEYYVCYINNNGYLDAAAAFYEDGKELIRLLNE